MIPLLLITAALAAEPDWHRVSHSCCRVTVDSVDGASQFHGTGCLVRPNLVLTNHHVVKDRRGLVTLVFPDKTTAVGVVVKSDERWDLAAVRIDPLELKPLPLAARPPGHLSRVWAGGFGPINRNRWRVVGGPLIGYVSTSPSGDKDTLDVPGVTEQGSSGGPIVNEYGEIVGVLWGSSTTTVGTSVRLVRRFMEGLE